MKKRMWIIVLVIALLMTGCVKTEISEDVLDAEVVEADANLKLAYEGKIDGIEFGIGSSTEEIIEAWGMADMVDYFAGGIYLNYSDKQVVFFTNSDRINNEISSGNVMKIAVYEESRSIYGVNIGDTFDEIDLILGGYANRYTPKYNQYSEYYQEQWTLIFEAGAYTVKFVAEEENSPVHTVYLELNN